ncbi:MAG: ATP-binding protein [Bacteroidia bacterium]|nr:ATP-binding protein [Bacteroidia bacterium]
MTNIIDNLYVFDMLNSGKDDYLFSNNQFMNIQENIQNLSAEFNRQITVYFSEDFYINPFISSYQNYICMELLYNAIKFSSNNDAIIFRYYMEQQQQVIAVINTGMGFNCLPKDLKPFNKFNTHLNNYGLGLGLYNIKTIAEKKWRYIISKYQ